jgi:hypothetical protein
MDKRLIWISNIIGIQVNRLSIADGGDVHIDGKIRYGYFGGNTFFRENPVARALRRRAIPIREGGVSDTNETQYDLVIDFDENGEVIYISDKRTSFEIDSLNIEKNK